MSSRILARNQGGISGGELGEVTSFVLPQFIKSDNVSWSWPTQVNTPFTYAYYVYRLHKQKGLSPKFPLGAFQRFASRNKTLGFEVLTRAAYMAATRANHPFSPKFIAKFLDHVPSKQVVAHALF